MEQEVFRIVGTVQKTTRPTPRYAAFKCPSSSDGEM